MRGVQLFREFEYGWPLLIAKQIGGGVNLNEVHVCHEGILSVELKLWMRNPSLSGVVENIIFMRESHQM